MKDDIELLEGVQGDEVVGKAERRLAGQIKEEVKRGHKLTEAERDFFRTAHQVGARRGRPKWATGGGWK